MKFLIALCFTFALVCADWTPLTKEQLLKDREECFKSENVPADVIEKLNKREYGEDLGQEARCYIRCLGLKGGNWDDENGYDVDRSFKSLESTGLHVELDNLKKCIRPNTDNLDKCSWAARDLKCLWINKYISKKE